MRGETILCVESASRWDALWRDSQQIMSRIARQNRVLFFEPGRHHEAPASTEFVRNLPNFLRLRTVQRQKDLYIIPTPSSVPYLRRQLPRSILQVTMPLVTKVNAMILIRQIHWAMKTLEVKAPILWLYGPAQIDLIGRFGEKAVCYFNYDEYADFVHNAHIRDLMQRWERRFLSRVDLIFATSQAQTERRKVFNPNTYFIPNGVDFELFNRALLPNLPLPDDIARLPRPIIGFAGWLGYHIDVPLLLRIAQSFGGCSLVFVGPEELPKSAERTELYTLPNVHFLGRKERTELPNYLQAFDVALMPWALQGHILSAYPLKLHEYLAAGRASVATALPELRPYGHVIRIAASHDEFIAHVGAALHDHSSQAIAARVAVARENTWDRRVADMYRILESHLHNRQQRQAGLSGVQQLVHG